jgi:hypothetical protein
MPNTRIAPVRARTVALRQSGRRRQKRNLRCQIARSMRCGPICRSKPVTTPCAARQFWTGFAIEMQGRKDAVQVRTGDAAARVIQAPSIGADSHLQHTDHECEFADRPRRITNRIRSRGRLRRCSRTLHARCAKTWHIATDGKTRHAESTKLGTFADCAARASESRLDHAPSAPMGKVALSAAEDRGLGDSSAAGTAASAAMRRVHLGTRRAGRFTKRTETAGNAETSIVRATLDLPGPHDLPGPARLEGPAGSFPDKPSARIAPDRPDVASRDTKRSRSYHGRSQVLAPRQAFPRER